MQAQGDMLGLFHLCADQAAALPEAKRQLARTVAEQLSLAIANLILRETLQHQSIRDPLTGLFNRRYLEESLTQEIQRAQRHQHPIGVIMLDIDHFKQVNDTYGHDAGDLALQAVGQILRERVRGSDIACRYGGEEMTLILPESSLEVTADRAEIIRQEIAQLQITYQGITLKALTASLGVACFPDHGFTTSALMKAADAALYQAKNKAATGWSDRARAAYGLANLYWRSRALPARSEGAATPGAGPSGQWPIDLRRSPYPNWAAAAHRRWGIGHRAAG